MTLVLYGVEFNGFLYIFFMCLQVSPNSGGGGNADDGCPKVTTQDYQQPPSLNYKQNEFQVQNRKKHKYHEGEEYVVTKEINVI